MAVRSGGTTSPTAAHATRAIAAHIATPYAMPDNNHSNPVRIESAKEAAEVDARIVRAWDGHPRRFFVESSDAFLKKVEYAIELIRAELPECCRSHRIKELAHRG